MWLKSSLTLFLLLRISLLSNSLESQTFSSKGKPSFLGLFRECEITLFGDMSTNDKYLNFFTQQSVHQAPVQLQTINAGAYSLREVNKVSRSPRFVPCRSQFFFLHDFSSSTKNSVNFRLLVKRLEGQVEVNPQYVIFVKSAKYDKLVAPSAADNVQSEQSFYANLYRTTLTSKFFVIAERSKSVSMVCMHCPSANVLDQLGPGDFSSREAVHRHWKLTHSSLASRSVEILRRKDERLNHPERCSVRDMIRAVAVGGGDHNQEAHGQLDADLCSIIQISRALNVTPYPTDHRLYGHVKYGTVMYADLIESMFLSPTSPAVYEWSSTGEGFESVTFITVAQKLLDIKAIWHPFQQPVWISLAVFFVSLSLCFGISISSRYEVAKTHFINAKFSFVLFTAILLEQKQLIYLNVRKQLSSPSVVIVTSWILVAFMYSLLYRSSIYTVISTLLPPSTPKTLLELPESGYHIATTSTYQLQGEFQSSILSALDEAIEPRTNISGYNSSTAKLEALRKSIQFVPARPAELLNSYVTSLRTFQQTVVITNHQNETGEHHLPRTFVLVGPEPELRVVSQLFTLYSRYVFVIKSADSAFVHRTPWVVRRNFFSKLFHVRLASLYENGLIQQLRTSGLIRSLEQEWLATDASMLARTGNNNHHKNHVLRLFHQEKDSRLHSEPWPIAAFASVLYLWIVCLDYCFTIFFLEWTAILVLRKFFNVRRNAVRHMKIEEP